MATEERLTLKVTVSQPALTIQGVEGEEVRQIALIAFGQWFKGDKGDSWETDYEVATNEDIDALFAEG